MGKTRESRDKKGSRVEQLLEEYSTSIETSTILSILSDYDLDDPAQSDQARQVLDILKDGAAQEEASGFDASGAGGTDLFIDGFRIEGDSESRSGSARSLPGWNTSTDDTSLGQGTSILDLEGLDLGESSVPSLRDESPEKSWTLPGEDTRTLAEKESLLTSIFPILKPFDIKHSLRQHNGHINLAIDDLMTQSFLEDNGIRHKGVDAFYEATPKRKGKKKGRKALAKSLDSPVTDLPSQSKWDKAKEDIEFISTKANLIESRVASQYHNSGGSVSETIIAIINSFRLAYPGDLDDPLVQVQAFELQEHFPSVSERNLYTLVQLTAPDIVSAQALAARLASPSTSTQNKNPIHIEFRHAPLNLTSTEPSFLSASKTAFAHTNAAESLAAAAGHIGARNQNYGKAAHYYKMGKSNHLMGGAAAYYAEEGRNHNVLAKQHSSAAADQHVASQSSRTELDLHGVNVKDALRISKEKVTTWWHELGEERLMVNRGGSSGYRIVTGVGIHSEGGRAKLMPAVGAMLVREGWKVEVGQGVLVVRGIAKKK